MSVKIAQVFSNTATCMRILLRTTVMMLLVLTLGGAALAQEQNQTQGPEQQQSGDPIYTRSGRGAGVCGEGDRRGRGESRGCPWKSGAVEFLGHVVRAMPDGGA